MQRQGDDNAIDVVASFSAPKQLKKPAALLRINLILLVNTLRVSSSKYRDTHTRERERERKYEG